VVDELVFKYNCAERMVGWDLAMETDQVQVGGNNKHVVTLGNVSLIKSKVKKNERSVEESCSMVQVPSTKENLREVADAVSCGQPVLLIGEVGVGKTSIVMSMAATTGRGLGADLLCLQVSDQTDSRLLVGLYRCTDIPGQFVWEPGLLTRAVTQGSWLLIEDIDRAPADVLALLAPLVQTGRLDVPSLGGKVDAAPGFQLFLTQRTDGGGVRQEVAKLVRTVTVRPLMKEELKQVVLETYPKLVVIIEKVLRFFDIVCKPGEYLHVQNEQAKVSSVMKNSRQISVRDLMKWCKRSLAIDIDGPSSKENLYLNSIDCFCRFIPNKSVRKILSEAIAFELNFTKDEASFYNSKYKPVTSQKSNGLQVGRCFLPYRSTVRSTRGVFSMTRHSAGLLEAVTMSVLAAEPVLLVGETGVGKTTSVQFLAQQTGRKLNVINMNQQSDSTDLLGGFRPVDISHSMIQLREVFSKVFQATFNSGDNRKFLSHVATCYAGQRWADAVKLMSHSLAAALVKVGKMGKNDAKIPVLTAQWKEVKAKLKIVDEILRRTDLATIFAFIEGTLTKAVREGEWILLDEVNMALPETLECLSALLEGEKGSVCLYERGDYRLLPRHSEFRLFACMNPATDTGKADLPPGLRNRFTEVYVDEMSEVADIRMLVSDYLQCLALPTKQINSIVEFYELAKKASQTKLTNGTGRRPTFSLRTLCRALNIASKNTCSSVRRSLYEAFSLSFLTELDRESHPIIEELIAKYIVGAKEASKLLKHSIPQPPNPMTVGVEGFWINAGGLEPIDQTGYILTDQVKRNLKDLSRIVSLCDHPVLIQGDTSVGKTSLVTYLANLTGNKCVRVNNHEHTDIQEYVGSYTADQSGKLVFKLGVLAEAMISGSWIILDELNLAPTDVLEALNRVLDDNRELYIPETQQTITASPGFRLFGTQNPPGQYGGRKVLSRAFRNRFLELHFDQLPEKELETILEKRCELPRSYSIKMVAVLGELQKTRRGSAAFAGKEGFITLRDLFRWAERYRLADQPPAGFYDWDQHLAEEGYLVLAPRVRNMVEVNLILEILQKVFKRSVDPNNLFSLHEKTSGVTRPLLNMLMSEATEKLFPELAWTFNMRRLAVLIGHAWQFSEPVLLVGETGCGKTTVVQVLSELHSRRLLMLNCHQHTESSDFLGGLRPARHKEQSEGGEVGLLFAWVDGPLVTAMKTGYVFLADEISLADDSVIERMNSVLEPERQILLAEKIGTHGTESEIVKAEKNFQFVATMNPGGDYGKKELSPALKNRFTEIWCPDASGSDDLLMIIRKNLNHKSIGLGQDQQMVDFVDWIKKNNAGSLETMSIRDLLAWAKFINKTTDMDVSFQHPCSFVQGASLVWLDGIQLCGQANSKQLNTFHSHSINKLLELSHGGEGCPSCTSTNPTLIEDEKQFSVLPFSIQKCSTIEHITSKYSFDATTTKTNAMKVLRALQIQKPILLEGSPGIGKTSLVEALAARLGQPLTRINLSDQTDVSDLFGADLPVEGGSAGQFAWRNGPFLNALEKGEWILLDELNLASQSVLEGLNAVFDHRGEVYIPELDRTFTLNPNTKIFGCQNPISEGGDRKGLPKSFLNRFSKVYMVGLSKADYVLICERLHPSLPESLVHRMVKFSKALEDAVVVSRRWGYQGAPWEFNLRDLLRWCQAMESDAAPQPGKYITLVYASKMRRLQDKENVLALYREIFEPDYMLVQSTNQLQLSQNWLALGEVKVKRSMHVPSDGKPLQLLQRQREVLELLGGCVNHTWPVILTGGDQAGKTSAVTLLARLAGRRLETLSLNTSTDAGELLGGFEQTDIDRSIGDVFQRMCHISDLQLEALVRDDCEEGLLFMQTMLQLRQSFAVKSKKKRHKDLIKLLSSHLEIMAKDCNGPHHLIEELEQEISSLANSLEDNSRKGTFEWVDSCLVRALRSGSWLILDNVNYCSASVLDRLNALFEPGGKLAVSERGVIQGKIPVISPHKDFRVFLLYDPAKGEISRAMRNRCVEIHLTGREETGLSEEDKASLVVGRLGSAAATGSVLLGGSRLDSGEGLHSACTAVEVMAHRMLSGEEAPLSAVDTCVSVAARKVCQMTNSNLVTASSSLAMVLRQMRPMLCLIKEDGKYSELSIKLFFHFLTSSDLSLRLHCLQWLLSLENATVQDCSEAICNNALLKLLYKSGLESSSPWDWRLCSRSSYQDVSIPNKLSLILDIGVRYRQLQRQVKENSYSLFSVLQGVVSDQAMAATGLDTEILTSYTTLVQNVLDKLTEELTTTEPLLDSTWNALEEGLIWFFRFSDIGLQRISRNNCDELTRTIIVHWRWVVKKLEMFLEENSFGELRQILDKFGKTVQSLSHLPVKSLTKFRTQMRSAPPPPSTLSQCALAQETLALDSEPALKSLLTAAKFRIKQNKAVNKELASHAKSEKSVQVVVASLQNLVNTFLPHANEEKVEIKEYLDSQLWAVRECMSSWRVNKVVDKDCMPFQLQLLLSQHVKSVGWEVDSEARLVLHRLYRPAHKMFSSLDYDPVTKSLCIIEDITDQGQGRTSLLSLVAKVAGVTEAGAGVAVSMHSEKIDQFKILVNDLKTLGENFKTDDLCLAGVVEEFKLLVFTACNVFTGSSVGNLDEDLAALVVCEDIAKNLIQALSTANIIITSSTTDQFTIQKLAAIVNLVKLQLYSSFGPMDPAEKQAIKHRYAVSELAKTEDRLHVLATFSDMLGCRHPHKQLLEDRKARLTAEVERRKELVAERGGASFISMSREVFHYTSSLGSIETVLSMLSNLSELWSEQKTGSALSEAQLWMKSTYNFITNLQKNCCFPDLVVPVAGSAASLLSNIHHMCNLLTEAHVHRSLSLVGSHKLEQTILQVTDPAVSSECRVSDQAAWLLQPKLNELLAGSGQLLIRSSLLTLVQGLAVSPVVATKSQGVVLEIVGRLLEAHQQDLLDREAKEEEDARIFKKQTFCDDLDEEEEDDEDYKKLFPSYADVFNDLIKETELVGAPTSEKQKDTSSTSKPSMNYCKIVDILQKYILLKQNDKPSVQALVESDFIERYSNVNHLVSSLPGISTDSIETSLIPHHVSLVNIVIKGMTEASLPAKYNFYSDPNLEEANLVRPLLEVVTARVFQLLEDFPENPVLLQVINVQTRIITFSANSPLCKFLTGLELLLTSCQEWEKNAHRGVSLQGVMEQITNLIFRWRRLELSGWKGLLAAKLADARRDTGTWWLHVAAVLQEAKRPGRGRKEETIRSLLRFMESASLADFQARLDILQSLKVVALWAEGPEWIGSVLSNVYCYYNGHRVQVEAALQERTKRAQDKIKEYVKMARWKDTSFWSVRIIVEKTRKTLHKTLREFEKSISVKCSSFMTEMKNDEEKKDSVVKKISDVICKPPALKEPLAVSTVTSSNGKIVRSFKSLQSKADKLTRKVVNKFQNLTLVEDIAEMLPNVITEMEKLQGLTVDLKKTKEEQKAQAGFIQQRKRRGLNDLFKSLQAMGLSYRYGQLHATDMNNYKEFLSCPGETLPEWSYFEKYFYRCWTRFRQLSPGLDKQLPAGVSPMVADRMQGFSQHLLMLMTDWRRMLIWSSKRLDSLQQTCAEFSSVDEYDITRSGREHRSLLTNIHDGLQSAVIAGNQMVKDWPEMTGLNVVVVGFSECLRKTVDALSSPVTVFITQSQVSQMKTLLEGLDLNLEKLRRIHNAVGKLPAKEKLEKMIQRIEEIKEEVAGWMEESSVTPPVDDAADAFSQTIDTLMVKNLIGIQEVFKVMSKLGAEESTWNANIDIMLNGLSVAKLSQLESCFGKIVSAMSAEASSSGASKMLNCTRDSTLLLNMHITSVRSLHNTALLAVTQYVKLLSVLLKIFNEITVKGFCPIKEFEDEDGEKGATDFKSSEEETGLGQGEGKEDISDKIDNEDMLDGAYQDPKDAEDKEEQKNEEEDNGIEMSDNFESNMQDKKDDDKNEEDDDEEDEDKKLDDEVGDVEGNEDLDKDMWGDENEEEDKGDMEESEEKGKTQEEEIDDLVGNEDQKEKGNDEKRERKDEKQEEPEFDDNQEDPYHTEDKKLPEPENFDLPEDMQLDEPNAIDNFEEQPEDLDPDVMPDFEDKKSDNDESDDEGDEDPSEEKTEIDNIQNEEDKDNEEIENKEEDLETGITKDEDGKEEAPEENPDICEKDRADQQHDGMDVDDEADQQAMDKTEETDAPKNDKGGEGMRDDPNTESKDDKSFGVKGKQDEIVEDKESGTGTQADQQKTLADESLGQGERLELVDGISSEEGKKEAGLYQHVHEEKEDDKAAVDKADMDQDIKEQVLPENWDVSKDKIEEKKEQREMAEQKGEKEKAGNKQAEAGSEEEEMDVDDKKDVEAVEAVSATAARGTDSLINENVTSMEMEVDVVHDDVEVSLEAIHLEDGDENSVPHVNHVAHQLCEQLRLILEPTKAAKLQGDFRTGKRLNMRKIIPYIASQFKKDKIWLRRIKPNKREYQILVALDDSSSMSDNKSRQIALQSLSTLCSALALLEVGQLGILRYGEEAQVLHSLQHQWAQTNVQRILNQFTFNQTKTSVVSMLNLSSQMFLKNKNSAARNTAVSQLLVVVSDGRGIFHEGREKVHQAVMRARSIGYFMIFLIVENPDNKDSVLDIRLPRFSDGQLVSIDSYIEHFPFQHYIVLRDVENLPHTLSDALRQWFELVTSQ